MTLPSKMNRYRHRAVERIATADIPLSTGREVVYGLLGRLRSRGLYLDAELQLFFDYCECELAG